MVTINIGRKEAVFFGILFIFIFVFSLTIAYNSGANPNVMGHDADELKVDVGGVPMTLQAAIDGGNIGGSKPASSGYVIGGSPGTKDFGTDWKYIIFTESSHIGGAGQPGGVIFKDGANWNATLFANGNYEEFVITSVQQCAGSGGSDKLCAQNSGGNLVFEVWSPLVINYIVFK